MSPRVSIAMTTFQGAAYVEEQLQSFVTQTRPPDQLILCDDASSDETLSLVERFATRAPFAVHFERNARNLETTPNFSHALSLTEGDVVFFADQDDIWRPDKIERILEVFARRPEVGAVFSNGRVVDAARRPLGYTLWDSLWFSQAERERVRAGAAVEVFARHVVAAGTTLAFRGRFRDLVLPFPDLHDCHDAWVSFLIACVAEVGLVEEELIDYRLHGANQFGLRRFGLREQLAKARWQLEQRIFDHNLRFFSAVRERLDAADRARFAAPDTVFALIDERIAHARLRDSLPRALPARARQVLRELRRGGYGRFAYGWKSVAQDLLLR